MKLKTTNEEFKYVKKAFELYPDNSIQRNAFIKGAEWILHIMGVEGYEVFKMKHNF
jgi:hypothetical protein